MTGSATALRQHVGQPEVDPSTAAELAKAGAWLGCWWDVVRSLPAAARLSSTLRVYERSDACPDDGQYDTEHDRIAVARDVPHEMLTTLLHEAAHALSNPRHFRHHGYSWRRVYRQLVRELLGEDPWQDAERLRRSVDGVESRMDGLDLAVIRALIRVRPVLVEVSPSHVVARCGDSIHRAKRSPPHACPLAPGQGVGLW